MLLTHNLHHNIPDHNILETKGDSNKTINANHTFHLEQEIC